MNNLNQKIRIEHIKDAILLINSFVQNQTETEFLADIKGQNAVLYQFLIIGEAIRNVDNTILNKYPYPWHIPKSFRNFIAHEYHKIKLESVFRATKDLNTLLKIVEQILKNEF